MDRVEFLHLLPDAVFPEGHIDRHGLAIGAGEEGLGSPQQDVTVRAAMLSFGPAEDHN